MSKFVGDNINEIAGVVLKSQKAGFDPNQQRGPSGRWGADGWHKIDVKQQVSSHKQFGGSTYSMDGKSMAGAKGMGAVGMFKERTLIMDSDLTEDVLNRFIEKNKDLLSLTDNKYAVGTWYGGEPKQLWLDISLVTNLENAIKIGKENNQVAIFDLENLDDVPTGGTGKYNVIVMRAKGKNRNKFDGLGRVLRANHPNPKAQTIEEYEAQTFKPKNGK